MPVEDAVFNEERLGRAIRKARVVIAECNLSGNQLALTSRLCAMKNTPLIVGGVSESKCKRIKLADSPIACFSLNTKEAKALVGDKPVPSAADYGVTICGIARSKYVVVTESSKGWTVYAADGTPQAFEAPKIGAIRSTSGAGDAIIAAIGHHLATEGSFEWAAIKATIHRFVDDVLRKRVASGADLTSIETLGAAYKGLLDQFKRPTVRIGAALSAVVSLLVLIAAFISAAVDLEQSNTVFSRLNQAYCWLLPNSTACERNETEDARR
jgi:hypothetical protein